MRSGISPMSEFEIFVKLFIERVIPAIIGLYLGGMIFFSWWHIHEIKENQKAIGAALNELLRRTPDASMLRFWGEADEDVYTLEDGEPVDLQKPQDQIP